MYKHELTHSISGTKSWAKFKDYVMSEVALNYKLEDLRQGFHQDYDELYRQGVISRVGNEESDVTNALNEMIDEEIIAEWVGDNLFDNEVAITDLVKNSRSTASQILTWIRDTLNKLTGKINADSAALRKAERMFAKALGEINNFEQDSSEDVRFSAKDISPDYETYIENRAQYVNDKRFEGWAHPELAYISAAAWDGAKIPLDILLSDSIVAEAQDRIDNIMKMEPYRQSESELNRNVERLLSSENLAARRDSKTGKIVKVKGEVAFDSPIAKEKKAFIVIGRPAGGKSSVFANVLSADNHARIIDSDIVKPWYNVYDDGYGAGYVQNASDEVFSEALYRASNLGENIVIPKIGGESIIEIAKDLKGLGYKVGLYFNEVSEESSIMRAASRFAQEGRYLSLNYLSSIGEKPYNTFINNAEATYNWGDLFDYAEWKNNDVEFGQQPRAVWTKEGRTSLSSFLAGSADGMVGGSLRGQVLGIDSKTQENQRKISASDNTGAFIDREDARYSAGMLDSDKDDIRYSVSSDLDQYNNSYHG